MPIDIPIEHLGVETFTIPTDRPESDGTLEWDHTVLVVAHAEAGVCRGTGYGYADRARPGALRRHRRFPDGGGAGRGLRRAAVGAHRPPCTPRSAAPAAP